MDKAHIMPCFLVLTLIFSGCGQDVRHTKRIEKQSESKTKIPEKADFFNPKLEKDANDGKTYTFYYNVLTDSVTPAYSQSLTWIKDLPRGTTFYHQFKRTSLDGYMDVMIDGKPYVISRRCGFFPQEYKGMKYPLFGFTAKDSEYVVFRDEYGIDKLYLTKGTPYLYVLRKENNYINVWDYRTQTFRTGEYCCEVKIIQRDAHLKINPSYQVGLRHLH